ncbi:unnamed protein product, partial [Didymodactylos carnosus]
MDDLQVSDDDMDIDSDSSFSPIHSNHPEDDEKKQIALNQFLKLCGNNNKVWMTDSYKKLSPQSKSNFLSRTRSIVRTVLEFVARVDDSDELL